MKKGEYMPSYGPFKVRKDALNTKIQVQPGDVIGIQSSGQVKLGFNFAGIGSWTVDANGTDSIAPPNKNFPAPGFREYSLVCRVGPIWFQGGTDRRFTVTTWPGGDLNTTAELGLK